MSFSNTAINYICYGLVSSDSAGLGYTTTEHNRLFGSLFLLVTSRLLTRRVSFRVPAEVANVSGWTRCVNIFYPGEWSSHGSQTDIQKWMVKTNQMFTHEKGKPVLAQFFETTWRKTDDNKPKGKGVARRWKRINLISNGGKVIRKSGDVQIKQEVDMTEQEHTKDSRANQTGGKRKENELIQQK